ncbi:MAG: hypothetical protein IIC52_13230 [Proteobacteria bacterium]|nr:hypothetical protein [Pseudomonadota bacterium]
MEYALYIAAVAALVAGGFLYIRREIGKPPSLFYTDADLPPSSNALDDRIEFVRREDHITRPRSTRK